MVSRAQRLLGIVRIIGQGQYLTMMAAVIWQVQQLNHCASEIHGNLWPMIRKY